MNLRSIASYSLALLLPLLSIGGVASLSGCSKSQQQLVPAQQAQSLLLDRNWIDRLPESPRDRLHVFRFVPTMGGGVFQDRTLFAGHFELFTFDHDGDTIRFHLHHTGDEHKSGYTIDRLPERSPDGSPNPLELHLHLSDTPRGPSDYYSIRGMNGHDFDEALRSLYTTAK